MSLGYAMFWSVPFIVSAVLALPALRTRSWLRFLIAWLQALFGIFLPLFFFFASALLIPDWKGNCKLGWVDCFYEGKLALTPLVLYATTAFYALEIWRVRDRARPWIVIGIFLGAVVSTGCFIVGMLIILQEADQGSICLMIVPFYTALWYVFRWLEIRKTSSLGVTAYVWSSLASLPFWLGSVIWSVGRYTMLPDKAPPDCFVVTAAGQGHECVVGPFTEIVRRGKVRRVNQQLVTFWNLESQWQRQSPSTHACFRHVYNRFGPVLARRIRSPWLADVVFLCLKPVEWIAVSLTTACRKSVNKGTR